MLLIFTLVLDFYPLVYKSSFRMMYVVDNIESVLTIYHHHSRLNRWNSIILCFLCYTWPYFLYTWSVFVLSSGLLQHSDLQNIHPTIFACRLSQQMAQHLPLSARIICWILYTLEATSHVCLYIEDWFGNTMRALRWQRMATLWFL